MSKLERKNDFIDMYIILMFLKMRDLRIEEQIKQIKNLLIEIKKNFLSKKEDTFEKRMSDIETNQSIFVKLR